MGDEVRGTPEAIDDVWVTEALEAAGVARGAKVTAVAFEGLIGTGQTGRNGRFSLTWDEPAGRPASVVAKFPSDDPTARAAAFANGSYLKEWTFYTTVEPTVRIRTPHVWAARYDAEAPDFVLLMEDVAGARQGDQLAGITPDQAALAVEQLIGLHAPRWGEAGLEAVLLGDQPAPTEQETVLLLQAMYGATMPGTLERLGARFDDDVVDLVHRLAEPIGRWALGTGTPRTLVHMDYRPDNLLFGVEPGADPLVVVDWQTASVGLGIIDLAYLLGAGVEPEVRREIERDLVEDYRQRMVAAGVEYSADDCWRDYRFGSIWGVAMTVIATMLAEETERGNDMLTAMGQRHGRHALDLDALSLLT